MLTDVLRGSRRIVAGCLLLLLLGTVAYGAMRSDDPPTAAAFPEEIGTVGKETSWPSRGWLGARSFSILRNAPSGIPVAIRRRVRRPSHGERWSQARRIPTHVQGVFWLIPGPSHLCLLARARGALGQVCAAWRRAIRSGVSLVILAPHPRMHAEDASRFMIGVAPDFARAACVYERQAVTRIPVNKKGVFVLTDGSNLPPTLVRPIRSRRCP